MSHERCLSQTADALLYQSSRLPEATHRHLTLIPLLTSCGSSLGSIVRLNTGRPVPFFRGEVIHFRVSRFRPASEFYDLSVFDFDFDHTSRQLDPVFSDRQSEA